MNLNVYLQNIESKVSSIKRTRKSKVEEDLYNIVLENIENDEPNTIKLLCEALNKRPQHLHQLIKKSERLTKVKVKGLSIVVPKIISPEEEKEILKNAPKMEENAEEVEESE